MPSLRDRIEALHLRPGDVIMEEWYEQLESLLKDITERGAVTYEGYITRDLIPVKDLAFDIGKPLKRIREIHAGYGHFDYQIRSGDIIPIEDLEFDIGKPTKRVRELHAGYGYLGSTFLSGDVTPVKDLVFDVGKPLRRVREIHAGYGYFSYQIRSGDVIPIKDLEFDIGKPTKRVREVHAGYGYFGQTTLSGDVIPTKDLEFDIGKPLKRIREVHAGYGYFLYGIFPHTTLLGIRQDYLAPEMQDVFDEHLTILFNGIARVKAKHEYDFYAYLYWIPKATGMGQLAALNEGKPIPAVVWKEMDFTVSKDDKVNVRVKPSGKVTIAVYNIPS